MSANGIIRQFIILYLVMVSPLSVCPAISFMLMVKPIGQNPEKALRFWSTSWKKNNLKLYALFLQ